EPTGDVLVATFSDTGLATDPCCSGARAAALILWGDGASSAGRVEAAGPGTFAVFGGHAYADAGSYPLSVRVTLGQGGTFTGFSTATVADQPLAAAGAPLPDTS